MVQKCFLLWKIFSDVCFSVDKCKLIYTAISHLPTADTVFLSETTGDVSTFLVEVDFYHYFFSLWPEKISCICLLQNNLLMT